ncbi:RBBP9/YdeN family alpha/beta hydrolase [Chitinilyticum litopenaei]|uniref:RBBP9/YdeN family alpha/beta hydrolase n=1 Tax=Chitinilyticum litopenaei TaxID=1121276 RepID=UPI0003F94884|nr:alpha/beta hydrolase [Chitinilyticum litopenaei]
MHVFTDWLRQGNSIVLVPGWRDSGPQHWQSRWQQHDPAMRRVVQDNWETPALQDWGIRLDATLQKASGQILIVAHSLGCLTVAHWAEHYRANTHRVHAALLVAPADSERPQRPWQGSGFSPRSRAPLPFPSLLVASDNDPACTPAAAQAMARDWRSRFTLLAGLGHINADSGLGDWLAGQALAATLLESRPLAGSSVASPPVMASPAQALG